MRVKIKSTGEIVEVLAIDFAGICIRKGEPSVIVNENDGCILLSDVEIILSGLSSLVAEVDSKYSAVLTEPNGKKHFWKKDGSYDGYDK